MGHVTTVLDVLGVLLVAVGVGAGLYQMTGSWFVLVVTGGLLLLAAWLFERRSAQGDAP